MGDKFSNWIFNSFSVTPEGLGLYRIFTALFILSFLMPPTEMYHFLGSLPSDFFNPPPGPMWLFEEFPSETIFLLLHSILILSLLCVLVGFTTPTFSVLVGVVLLIIKGFFYSTGKINHDLLLAVVPIVMAFSGWGAAYSIDSLVQNKSRDVHSWPLTLIALFIGFMMFTAGFAKVLGGWLKPETHATLGHFLNQYFVNGRQDLLAGYILDFDYRFVWEMLDYATILFEIGFLLAIINPRSTRLFICFAVVFHFSIMMMLNISFIPNFLAYAAFLDWTLIHQKIKKWLPKQLSPTAGLFGGFVFLWSVIFISTRLHVPELNSDLTLPEFYVLLFAFPVALFYITSQIYTGIRHS